MFFFCKPKKLVVDAFSFSPNIIDLLPPKPASIFKPKWWYEVPSSILSSHGSGVKFKQNTMRRCQGFKDYYSDLSLIIPLWTSFILEYTDTGSVPIFADGISELEYQSDLQRGNEYLKNFHNFKLFSPWRFKEKSGVNFLFSQAFYNFRDPTEFIMPPAIINFKYQHAAQVNFFVKKPIPNTSARLELEAGQPLVYLTPLSEKRIDLRLHLVSKEEFKNICVPVFYFSGSYSKAKKLGYGK